MVSLDKVRTISILVAAVLTEALERDWLRHKDVTTGTMSVARLKIAYLAIDITLDVTYSAAPAGSYSTKLALHVDWFPHARACSLCALHLLLHLLEALLAEHELVDGTVTRG